MTPPTCTDQALKSKRSFDRAGKVGYMTECDQQIMTNRVRPRLLSILTVIRVSCQNSCESILPIVLGKYSSLPVIPHPRSLRESFFSNYRLVTSNKLQFVKNQHRNFFYLIRIKPWWQILDVYYITGMKWWNKTLINEIN